MKCIGKYSKLIAVLSLTAMVTTGCGFGSKNVVADYEIENYNTNLYTGDLFASDLCVASGDVNLKGITSAETDTLHSAALFDVDGKKVDFSYQMFDKIYPASTTKLMTALVALENADLSDVVTVSQNAEMNSFAAELGCTGTHFTNPHGLQDENHYTTPYDIYLMLKEALNYPEFTDITQMASYTVSYKHSDGSDASATLPATDHYLTGEAATPKDVTILGGKTGTTDKAGNCLALLSQNAYGKPFISIVMGASSKDVLYQEMTSLLQNIN